MKHRVKATLALVLVLTAGFCSGMAVYESVKLSQSVRAAIVTRKSG